MLTVDWNTFKSAIATGLAYKYYTVGNSYYVYLYDGPLEIVTIIPITSPTNATQDDFEANYKSASFSTLGQYDTDGASITRNKAAKKGWTYCSLPFEFQTSRLSDTLFSQDSTGTSRSFITMKVYDNTDTEVTTAGLLNANYATIVKTVVDFEPPYDFEIIGGVLRTLTSISADIRLWIVAVPDIPANMGGSKEMGGGINLRYLAPGNEFAVDGRVTKFAAYSATYHTNKIRLIFKYPAGTNESLQTVVELYKQ